MSLTTTLPLAGQFSMVLAAGMFLGMVAKLSPGYFLLAVAVAAFAAIARYVRDYCKALSTAEYGTALALCGGLAVLLLAVAVRQGAAWIAAAVAIVAVVLSPWFTRVAILRGRIPLPIGFAMFGTSQYEAEMAADRKALGPLFVRQRSAPRDSAPTASVLFVYADLDDNGMIRRMPMPCSIRDVIAMTRADIVVVASPCSPEAVQATLALPGPRTANIVFVLDRKGGSLARFMRRLFQDMGRGTEMLDAWVRIAPQGEAAAMQPDAPATMLLAERGKLAFRIR
jgi:hypothetical protein